MPLTVNLPPPSAQRTADVPTTGRTWLTMAAIVAVGLMGAVAARVILPSAGSPDTDTPRAVIVFVAVLGASVPFSLSVVVIASGLALDRVLRPARRLRWASAVLLATAVMPFDAALGAPGFAVNVALLVAALEVLRRGRHGSTPPPR